MLEILEGREKIAYLEETAKKATETESRGDQNGVNIKQWRIIWWLNLISGALNLVYARWDLTHKKYISHN